MPGETFPYANRPLSFAHRGASTVAPENTLAAFQRAREAGADGVELDAMLSADGEVVVRHDYVVDSTTSGRGRVRDHSLAELKALDAGAWFGARFVGERVPTLREVCAWAGQDMLLNIELKTMDAGPTALERNTIALVREFGLERRAVLSSFNPVSLWRVKREAPELHTGLLYAADLPIYLRRAWLRPLVRANALHPHFGMVDDTYVRWARSRGYRVNVWTPDEISDLQRLIGLRVDGIITNRPERLAALLAGPAPLPAGGNQ
jgi:glycerophosphoryl diester phosphodiesterase